MRVVNKVLLCLLCCSLWFNTAQSSDMSLQLKQLDELRFKDRASFSQAINALKLESDNLSLADEDQAYLAFLYAWDLALAGDFTTALATLERIAPMADNELRLRITGLQVNIHILSYRYVDAFLGVEQLLTALPSLQNDTTYTQIIGPIILLYNNIERFELVQHLIDSGLKITESDAIRCRLQAPGLYGSYKTLPFTDYSRIFEQVHTLCEQSHESIFNLLLIRNHMLYLLEEGQPAQTLALYEQYYPQVASTNYPILSAGFHAAAAQALLQQNNLAAATAMAAAAEKMLPSDRQDPAVLATFKARYVIARTQGDFNELAYYAEKLRETEQAISEEKASQQLAYQMASNETRLREQRIKLLDKDNELLTLERNLYQQQAQNQYLWLILLCGITLALAAFAYRSVKHSRRFRYMAEFDQLTGISNRHHFYQQAHLAVKYCQQNKQPIAVILFDLDFFKTVNDNYGHAAGDWVLQQIVRCCGNFIRNNDIFGRLGGEEFAIILPNCTQEKAEMLAEICRDAIANINAEHIAKQFSLTASFGVSDATQAGYDLSELLAAADKALYKAKTHGRNQVWSLA